MGAFIMLVIIGLAVIWILLSRHFEQIGRFFSGMSPGDKDKKESEEHDVKITDQLIRMKEAEARLKHGWVTVQGSDTVVTKDADSDK